MSKPVGRHGVVASILICRAAHTTEIVALHGMCLAVYPHSRPSIPAWVYENLQLPPVDNRKLANRLHSASSPQKQTSRANLKQQNFHLRYPGPILLPSLDAELQAVKEILFLGGDGCQSVLCSDVHTIRTTT